MEWGPTLILVACSTVISFSWICRVFHIFSEKWGIVPGEQPTLMNNVIGVFIVTCQLLCQWFWLFHLLWARVVGVGRGVGYEVGLGVHCACFIWEKYVQRCRTYRSVLCWFWCLAKGDSFLDTTSSCSTETLWTEGLSRWNAFSLCSVLSCSTQTTFSWPEVRLCGHWFLLVLDCIFIQFLLCSHLALKSTVSSKIALCCFLNFSLQSNLQQRNFNKWCFLLLLLLCFLRNRNKNAES